MPRLQNHRLASVGSFAAVAVLAAALLMTGLSSFGIWDPWELEVADAARRVSSGEPLPTDGPALNVRLVALAFGALGISEQAGRLPIALAGVLVVILAYLLGARYADRRTGLYAALATASTPLLLLNARPMLGDAPAMLGQALLGLGALGMVLPGRSGIERALWSACAAGGAITATLGAGVLLGVLPPLGAATALIVFGGRHVPGRDPLGRLLRGGIVASTASLAIAVTLAVAEDRDAFSYLLGGRPRGVSPPSFDKPLETVFYGLAPWSAVLPLAIGSLWSKHSPWSAWRPRTGRDSGAGQTEPHGGMLRPYVLVWASLALAAHTVYVSRYGHAAFLGVVALGVAVALWLRDLDRAERANWGLGLACAMFAGLLLRDLGLYPESVLEALPMEGMKVPAKLDAKLSWTATVGSFGLAGLAVAASDPERRALEPRAPYRLLAAQWRQGWGHRAWLVILGLIALGIVATAGHALVTGAKGGLSTFAAKWAKRGGAAVVLLPVVVLGMQLVRWLIARLGSYRSLPLLVAGLATGLYVAHGFLPKLSAHFSPRGVYESYNQLADPGEPLGEFRVGSRAAAYYVRGELEELGSQDELVRFLLGEGRRWAAFPSDKLPHVDHAFRKRAGRHLFVVDARSAQAMLATNRPIDGRANRNPLADSVRDSLPDIAHRVGARFGDKLELVGYNLDLPRDGHVGAGESFGITWVYRVLGHVPGGYKVFVHVDGHGQRINGDHEPVQGKYPLRFWEPGDVILDHQRISVAAHYDPGHYTLYTGLFSGSRRLKVTEGPQDGEDRIRAGTLEVR